MSSCEKKLNGYVNLKRTVGYQSTKIGKFACYILACLSSCLITEWLQLPHEATSSCHRVCVYCTVSCFAGRYVYVYGSDRAKAKAKTYLTVAVYSLISLLFFVCSYIFLAFAPAFAYVNSTKNCNEHIGDK